MPTALFIKNLRDFIGQASLYRLDTPIAYRSLWDDDAHHTQFVVVSSIDTPPEEGPETFIFPALKDGTVINFCDLPGSYRGGMSHVTALNGAGYEVSIDITKGGEGNQS